MTQIPEQQSREEIMNIVRKALWDYGDMYALAIRTGLSRSCLNNIRRGHTQWPRWNTLEIIMIPLKLRLTMRQY